MDLRICEKCKNEIPKKANFCPNCGTEIYKIIREEFVISSDDLIKKIKEIIHEGNIRKIIVKDDKKNIILEIPVTVGIVGTILAPWLAALGVIAALFTKCIITIERIE